MKFPPSIFAYAPLTKLFYVSRIYSESLNINSIKKVVVKPITPVYDAQMAFDVDLTVQCLIEPSSHSGM
jgi:hypothetical protein